MDGTFNARAEAKKIEESAFSILREHARGYNTTNEQSELAKELASFWGDHNKRASVGAAIEDDYKREGLHKLDWLIPVAERKSASADFDDRKILSGLEFELHSGKFDRDFPSMYIRGFDSVVDPEIVVMVGNGATLGYSATSVFAPLLNGDDDRQ
ncbi:MAG TPA: hypothetical protein V6C97_21015 [Oculatellaceae cyanobacterium]